MAVAEAVEREPESMDVYVSEIVAVIDRQHSAEMDKMVQDLKGHGMDVTDVNRSEGVVEGTCQSSKLRVIDDLPGVEYVRTVFTYLADYGPSDGSSKGSNDGPSDSTSDSAGDSRAGQ